MYFGREVVDPPPPKALWRTGGGWIGDDNGAGLGGGGNLEKWRVKVLLEADEGRGDQRKNSGAPSP